MEKKLFLFVQGERDVEVVDNYYYRGYGFQVIIMVVIVILPLYSLLVIGDGCVMTGGLIWLGGCYGLCGKGWGRFFF